MADEDVQGVCPTSPRPEHIGGAAGMILQAGSVRSSDNSSLDAARHRYYFEDKAREGEIHVWNGSSERLIRRRACGMVKDIRSYVALAIRLRGCKVRSDSRTPFQPSQSHSKPTSYFGDLAQTSDGRPCRGGRWRGHGVGTTRNLRLNSVSLPGLLPNCVSCVPTVFLQLLQFQMPVA